MHSLTPDGRTVRELIGEDAWQFIDRTMVAVYGWTCGTSSRTGLRAAGSACHP